MGTERRACLLEGGTLLQEFFFPSYENESGQGEIPYNEASKQALNQWTSALKEGV